MVGRGPFSHNIRSALNSCTADRLALSPIHIHHRHITSEDPGLLVNERDVCSRLTEEESPWLGPTNPLFSPAIASWM
jgi:hypothetical protein